MKQKNTDKKGFTLAELIASVAITSILMAGMAAFFSNSFRQIFSEGYKIAKLQGPTVVSASLGKKFIDVADLEEAGSAGAFAVLKNDTKDGTLPFTYIGTKMVDGTERIVFKDFFVFNGRSADKKSMDSTIENPGGMANIATDYYVTAPLENKIYKCNASLNVCTALNIGGLNQPMDIATDGTDLYVTDAGNNRVIKIEDMGGENKVSVILSEDLNFPTGIVYYLTGGHDYLFVSDTYHHLVKKINLSNSEWTVVAGQGKDKICGPTDGREHSALFCELNFPTGLVISSGDDPDGDSLYISDTGNGRVLKVSEPRPDLTSFVLPFTLVSGSQISKVDFVLPMGSNIGSVSEKNPNDFHKAVLSHSETTITASLSAPMTGSFMVDVCPGDPDPCVSYFRGFDVAAASNIFSNGDTLNINETPFAVLGVPSDEGGNVWRVPINPPNTTTSFPANTPVRITKTFDANNYHFNLDLSNVTFPAGFHTIEIQPFDGNGTVITDAFNAVPLRVGNQELGTAEDVIKVFADHPYPTGLGWSNDALVVSQKADYVFDPSSIYDYTSDFEVRDFEFTPYNLDGAPGTELLQLDYEAHLGETPTGEEVWKPYSLSANLNK